MGQLIHVEVRYQRCAGKHFVEKCERWSENAEEVADNDVNSRLPET